MSAETIAMALCGRRSGQGWVARCPAHNDRKPSLSISDASGGKVLIHCHAGCDQAQVIDALRAKGLWAEQGLRSFSRPAHRNIQKSHAADRDDAKRTEAALLIWTESKPAGGTLVEAYLASRGICLPPPGTLRFHPGLKHPSGGIWPTLVALVTKGADGTPLAIHRTFLARDGIGKALVDPPKMMLGPCGGGCVILGHVDDTCIVGEGIETILSAMQLWQLPGCAALSAGGLASLPGALLPRHVLIAADNDPPGINAALALQQRLLGAGKDAKVLCPIAPANDFNDLVRPKNMSRVAHG